MKPNDIQSLKGLFQLINDGPNVAETLARLMGSSVDQPLGQLRSTLDSLRDQFNLLVSTTAQQTGAVSENTRAVAENTLALLQTGTKKGSVLGSVFKTVFGSIFGVSPLVSAIAGLFRDDDRPTVSSLTPFQRPVPIHIEARFSASEGAVSFDNLTPAAVTTSNPPRPSSPLPIVIQVQAFDSRSFIDHSGEIVQALKQAILSSNSINDILKEI